MPTLRRGRRVERTPRQSQQDWSAYQRPQQEPQRQAPSYDDSYYDDPYDVNPDAAQRGWNDPAYSSNPPPRQPETPIRRGGKSPLIHRIWVALVLLILLPPLGIILLWQKDRLRMWVKILLTLLSAAWLFAVVYFFFGRDQAAVQGPNPSGDTAGVIEIPFYEANPSSYVQSADAPQAAETQEAGAQSNPLLAAYPVQTAQVTGENGQPMGQRAYVEIPASVLESAAPADVTGFLNVSVLSGDYNWFTIFLDDGRGIVFANGSLSMGAVGPVDGEGRNTSVQGYMVRGADGTYQYEENAN